MKKISRISTGLVLSFLFIGQIYAQNATVTNASKETPVKQTTSVTQSKFVDNNKNGICDNWEAKHATAKNNTGTCNKGSVNCPKYQGSDKCRGNSDCCGQVCKENKNCGRGNCQPNPNCCKKDQGKSEPDKK